MCAESHYDDVVVICLQNKIKTMHAWDFPPISHQGAITKDSLAPLYVWLCFVDVSYREYRFSVTWHCVYRVTSATSPTINVMYIAPSTIKL